MKPLLWFPQRDNKRFLHSARNVITVRTAYFLLVNLPNKIKCKNYNIFQTSIWRQGVQEPMGLKIHQAKMKCMQTVQASQRSGTTLGETQEGPGLESPHNARNLQVTQASVPCRPSEHRWVKWPQFCKKK